MDNKINQYKIFRENELENELGKVKIIVEDFSNEQDYYAGIAKQRELGRFQVIMTKDILFSVVERLEKEFMIKSVDISDNKAGSQLITNVLSGVNESLSRIEVLEILLRGVSIANYEGELLSLVMSNDEQAIEFKVNGVINFKEKPSEELIDLIAKLTEDRFNR